MATAALLIRGIAWTTALGIIVVVMPIPFNMFAMLVWAIAFVRALMRHDRDENSGIRRASAITQCVLMAALIVGAMYAPYKKTEEILARRVTLPKARMTLGELRDWMEIPWPPSGLPVRITPSFDPRTENEQVAWPARELSVRAFLANLEEQTGLCHRFASCGNGWTILGGEDCSFGIRLYSPGR